MWKDLLPAASLACALSQNGMCALTIRAQSSPNNLRLCFKFLNEGSKPTLHFMWQHNNSQVLLYIKKMQPVFLKSDIP